MQYALHTVQILYLRRHVIQIIIIWNIIFCCSMHIRVSHDKKIFFEIEVSSKLWNVQRLSWIELKFRASSIFSFWNSGAFPEYPNYYYNKTKSIFFEAPCIMQCNFLIFTESCLIIWSFSKWIFSAEMHEFSSGKFRYKLFHLSKFNNRTVCNYVNVLQGNTV